MGTRVVKHLGSRACAADDTAVLTLVPTFPGEKLLSVEMSAFFACGGDSAIDQPSEVNWCGLFLPWHTVFTTSLVVTGGSLVDYDSVAEYDTLFKQWVLETGGDGTEYYGGDHGGGTEDKEDELPTDEHSDEELIDSGPIGASRWFNREVVMRPYAAEGVDTIRFGDDFEAKLSNLPSAGMGGLHMFGLVRYEHSAETNFNVEWDDAASKMGLGLLTSGDYTKVQAMIESNTADLGDFIRTVLFGGDNYIESDTLKGETGKGTVKMSCAISTPLSRRS